MPPARPQTARCYLQRRAAAAPLDLTNCHAPAPRTDISDRTLASPTCGGPRAPTHSMPRGLVPFCGPVGVGFPAQGPEHNDAYMSHPGVRPRGTVAAESDSDPTTVTLKSVASKRQIYVNLR